MCTSASSYQSLPSADVAIGRDAWAAHAKEACEWTARCTSYYVSHKQGLKPGSTLASLTVDLTSRAHVRQTYKRCWWDQLNSYTCELGAALCEGTESSSSCVSLSIELGPSSRPILCACHPC